ncbi:MAG: glycosyltransferase family 4 protein [Candidatus Pacebacteria bacterium]|nr:glycosyltransferase family 4 protein [Candidatus Paceibacterota bacterium]
MKIGLVSFHSFFNPGGVKAHILGLQTEFKKRGIKSKIIVPRRKIPENYGKDVILLGTSLPLKIAGTQADFDIGFNPFSITEMLKREKFDVLHFHNFSFPLGFQILERSKSLNILTFHANIEKVKIFKTFPFILDVFRKEVIDEIDGIIGVNPLNLKVFKNYKGPKIVIPNGIDLDKFNPRVPKIKKYLDGKINILFLGRIEERKGLIYLLKAYKILEKKVGNGWANSNLRLIVVGEGPLKDDCEKFVRDNKLKNVVFEGENRKIPAASYYATADIYCSPAIYGESFGIVLIEAMAVGKPVVAFANSGYEIVLGKGKGKNFLAKPKDYRTLAKKLEILIKNKKLRKEMGEWGKKEARKYSWPRIADEVLAFYKLCQKRKSKSS